MKKYLGGLFLLSILGCSQSWDQGQGIDRVMLEDIQVLQGKHCESSALINALSYMGYDISESSVVGAGGAMGFLYQRGDFPFMGGRSLTMKEVFFDSTGIPWQAGDNGSEEAAWSEVLEQLQEGKPVILRVDMRYLPYLYGGKYGPKYTSFGWHIICLYGIDYQRKVAYVSDTAQAGLQEIKLKDLHKARFSDTPFLAPNGEYYWVEAKPETFSLDWSSMLDRSVEEWIKNYQSGEELAQERSTELGGLYGLKQLSGEIARLDSETKPYLLPMVLHSMHGWIEEYGTGGAAFRQFSRDYLAKTYDQTEDPRIPEAISLMDDCIQAWHDFSETCQQAGNQLSLEKDSESVGTWLQNAAEKAEVLYTRENAFYQYLKQNWEY